MSELTDNAPIGSDYLTDQRRALIDSNARFVAALTQAIRLGLEYPRSITATVRTGFEVNGRRFQQRVKPKPRGSEGQFERAIREWKPERGR